MNDAISAAAQAASSCLDQDYDSWHSSISKSWQPAVEEVTEQYFKAARHSFKESDHIQGAETLTDAVRATMGYIAATRNWPHRSHDNLYAIAAALGSGRDWPNTLEEFDRALENSTEAGDQLSSALGASMGLPGSLRFGSYCDNPQGRGRKRIQLRRLRNPTGPPAGQLGSPMNQEEHLSTARDLMTRASQESQDGGNDVIAAEFLWGAFAHCLIVVAQNEGLPHDSHGAFTRIAQHMDAAKGGNRWRSYFGSGDQLHQHFYHGHPAGTGTGLPHQADHPGHPGTPGKALTGHPQSASHQSHLNNPEGLYDRPRCRRRRRQPTPRPSAVCDSSAGSLHRRRARSLALATSFRKPPLDTLTNLSHAIAKEREQMDALVLIAPGMYGSEEFHSRIISWLLNPSAHHRQAGHFIAALLNATMALPQLLDADWSAAQVYQEWEHVVDGRLGYLDILVLDQENQNLIAIENKVFSQEHSNQLTRYRLALADSYPDFTRHHIFLSPGGVSPNLGRDRNDWQPARYSVIHNAIQEVLDTGIADPNADALLQIYATTIRRNVMPDTSLDQ